MRYEKIVKARFISRPNRFIAKVDIDGQETVAHVKNTGRCKGLLVPDATVYLEDFTGNMRSRKLAYSIISVEKVCDDRKMLLINMDSQAPNRVVRESLESGSLFLPEFGELDLIKSEAVYGDSRMDFYIRDVSGQEGYIEVKGVTLEASGIASFPDAPTGRGIKHLNELSGLVKKGYQAYVIFVVQMEGVKSFRPNEERHMAFAEALRMADKNGVKVHAYGCKVKKDVLALDCPIPVCL